MGSWLQLNLLAENGSTLIVMNSSLENIHPSSRFLIKTEGVCRYRLNAVDELKSTPQASVCHFTRSWTFVRVGGL